jgi:hypothetical protein
MLPQDMEARRAVFTAIHDVLSVSRDISGETAKRLHRIAQLFGVSEGYREKGGSPVNPQAKAS